MTEKLCPGIGATPELPVETCGVKPIGDFYVSKGRFDTVCKVHRGMLQRRADARRPEAVRERKRLHVHGKRLGQYFYRDLGTGEIRHMKEDDFDYELVAQQGRCKITSCRFEFSDRAPDVDHDHETMWFRGLLCHSCNLSIHDSHSIAWYLAVADYLRPTL